MDKLKIENLGKKHIKLLLTHIETIIIVSPALRKFILDQMNHFVRELQELLGE